MHIHNLSEQNSLLNAFLYELRHVEIQKDHMRFRKNIQRIGEILSYEMSKTLGFKSSMVKTPLGEKSTVLHEEDIVICSILRAGLTLHVGVLNYFDKAENAFISAFRKHDPKDTSQFEIIVEYMACPNLEGKTLVLVDPMLASGQSFHLTFEALKPYGKPKQVHLLSILASEEGVAFVNEKFPADSHIWVADIDPLLNDYAYIVPGLGDAGDLAYGPKLQH